MTFYRFAFFRFFIPEFHLILVNGRNRNVPGHSEFNLSIQPIRALDNIPFSITLTKNRDVGFAVAVIISGLRRVGCQTDVFNSHRAGFALGNIPNAAAINKNFGYKALL